MNSIGLSDTDASCSLIAINQLPEDLANSLTRRTPVRGIGGSQNILGNFQCKVTIANAFFTNVEFLVVENLLQGEKVYRNCIPPQQSPRQGLLLSYINYIRLM